MKLLIYQVDAFSSKLFSGNPAAVCPLKKWLPEDLMQNIAAENNLAETAFIVKNGKEFDIRWFTPLVEVKLCGHATLASAHVLFNHLHYKQDRLAFNSKSGKLYVSRAGEMLSLNFPAGHVRKFPLPAGIVKALKTKPVECYKGKTDYLLVYNTQKEIEKLNPDFSMLSKVNARGIICTAKGNAIDFVSRFFAPRVGINEDPVTGSAHTLLIPYWSKRLKKDELKAQQLSKRGGELYCRSEGGRVHISGYAVTYLIGEIIVKS